MRMTNNNKKRESELFNPLKGFYFIFVFIP